ncbi:MAG TPA: F0F1 ATP synthase subunit epsilon [Dehalococcoidia bacterium]|jgi:F-type H+-transporting ATPase subunit epsilon|nr:ATP synthase F1 subunit epsilon [Chloroflexota bacterium]MDP5877081.1 F0F1 ATP synthase subunit epsilon [Dehalococcoidia bacterium]MDP6273269.1 F0F1 ATP synthase subunit epsilon [Dehalococcoidia bacterium]MDP7161564.1 F0F1 ATP synthase subunit epsilon [Dehalococcoidia bacterium]MDP7214012.1 F0F1 ATP synthase subunit epsilon [Dehalococcoidia bacterium]|tara:strand:+ start:1412 stop:1861 length:450 start_codon:yes stop_codon:yes gene_type:complete
MATFTLTIVTAESEVFSEEIDSLVAPGIDGQLGILPNHAPLMTQLQPGEMTIRSNNGENVLAVTGGFLEVLNNQVTILADTAEMDVEIDLERAEAALQRATERVETRQADVDLARALSAFRRAQIRVDLARRRGRRRSADTPPGSIPGA